MLSCLQQSRTCAIPLRSAQLPHRRAASWPAVLASDLRENMSLRTRLTSFLAGFAVAGGATFYQLHKEINSSSEYLAAQVRLAALLLRMVYLHQHLLAAAENVPCTEMQARGLLLYAGQPHCKLALANGCSKSCSNCNTKHAAAAQAPNASMHSWHSWLPANLYPSGYTAPAPLCCHEGHLCIRSNIVWNNWQQWMHALIDAT